MFRYLQHFLVFFTPSPQSHRVGWRRWAAITFFVFDLLTMLLGLALLLLDYHSNVVAGFALMGIGNSSQEPSPRT